MEINNPNTGKSDHQTLWSVDELQSSSSHGNKSYTCAFCKRGFSNAQALGGHMNIHRKDRAKLKQASDENLLSLDITRSSATSSIDHQVSEDKNLSLPPSGSSEERSDDFPKRASSLSTEVDQSMPTTEEDTREKPQQLALFMDRKAGDYSGGDHENIMKMQSSEGSSQGQVLDLELRLGPEPHETSSTKSTREFF